jgi:hypothetical protein
MRLQKFRMCEGNFASYGKTAVNSPRLWASSRRPRPAGAGASSVKAKFLSDSGGMGAVWHAACSNTMI